MFAIYRVVNGLTGDSYVGFTTKMNPELRFERHKRNALRGMKFHLYAAMRKYGTENFSFEILEIGENADYGHKVAEPLYIAWLHPTYNMTKGGDGVVGYVYTEEAKAAIRKGMIGQTHSQERKLANSLSKVGKPLSQDHRKAIANSLRGKPKTDAHRKANSEAQKKRSCRLTEDPQAFNL